jgi:hypothetical protein
VVACVALGELGVVSYSSDLSIMSYVDAAMLFLKWGNTPHTLHQSMHMAFVALLSSSVITVHGSQRFSTKISHLKTNNATMLNFELC